MLITARIDFLISLEYHNGGKAFCFQVYGLFSSYFHPFNRFVCLGASFTSYHCII